MSNPPPSVVAGLPATIPVLLDGRRHEVPAGTSVAALLEGLGHAPAAVATAVNGSFVARAQRPQRVLQPGDAVLLFQPIVGG
jgi:sulfur carrier protein